MFALLEAILWLGFVGFNPKSTGAVFSLEIELKHARYEPVRVQQQFDVGRE